MRPKNCRFWEQASFRSIQCSIREREQGLDKFRIVLRSYIVIDIIPNNKSCC